MLTSDPAVIAEARRALDATGYRVDVLAERLGTGTTLRVERTDVPALRLRLDPTRGLDALALLLLLELEVDAETVGRALGDAFGPLLASGLIEPAGGYLRPGASVVPHDDLLIASDRHDGDGRADIVPGVQRPSDLLARLTPRPQVYHAPLISAPAAASKPCCWRVTAIMSLLPTSVRGPSRSRRSMPR